MNEGLRCTPAPFFCLLQYTKSFQYIIISDLLCPGKSTEIFSGLPSRLYDRKGYSSGCPSAVTQTLSKSVSMLWTQLHSLGQGQYMSQYCSTYGPNHARCIYEHDHAHTRTHTQLRRKCALLSHLHLGSVCSLKCQCFHNLYPCLHSPWPMAHRLRSKCISN